MLRRPKILAALAAVALPITLTGVSSGGPPAAAAPPPAPAAVEASAYSAAAAKYGVPESVLLAVSYSESRWDDHRGAAEHVGRLRPDAPHRSRPQRGRRTCPASRRSPGLVVADALQGLRPDWSGPGRAAHRRRGQHQRRCRTAGVVPATLGLPVGADSLSGRLVRRSGVVRGSRGPGARPASPTTSIDHGPRCRPDDGRPGSRSCCRRRCHAGQGTGQQADTAPRARSRRIRSGVPAGAAGASGSRRRTRSSELAGRLRQPRPRRTARTTSKIDYIVIHDTEGTWHDVRSTWCRTRPTWAGTTRCARPTATSPSTSRPRTSAWHAGNWYVNAQSIGIEHEGFAAARATWYTEAMYRTSAKLVQLPGREVRHPAGPAHIIGHDNVPGTLPATVAGMHWDPGPYWDWEHYFDLLGAPITAPRSR